VVRHSPTRRTHSAESFHDESVLRTGPCKAPTHIPISTMAHIREHDPVFHHRILFVPIVLWNGHSDQCGARDHSVDRAEIITVVRKML
jgi:hypothetical protein